MKETIQTGLVGPAVRNPLANASLTVHIGTSNPLESE
jgi:hypothetical protein